MRFNPFDFRGRELGHSNEESPYQKSARQADELTKIAAQYISKEKDNSAAYGRAILRTANRFLSAKSLKELNGGVRLYGYSEMLSFFLPILFKECSNRTDEIREVFLAELERELGTEVVERYEHRLKKSFDKMSHQIVRFCITYRDQLIQYFDQRINRRQAQFESDWGWSITVATIKSGRNIIEARIYLSGLKDEKISRGGKDYAGTYDPLLITYETSKMEGVRKTKSHIASECIPRTSNKQRLTVNGSNILGPIADSLDENTITQMDKIDVDTLSGQFGFSAPELEAAPVPGGRGTEPIAAMAPEGREDADLVAEPTRMPDATDDFAREQGEENTTAESTLGAHQETEEELKQRRLNALRNQLQQGGKEQ